MRPYPSVSEIFRRSGTGLLWALPFALACWALAPVISPGMTGDDFGLYAYARLTAWPWTFYLEDHSSSYFYRPNTMLLWWASVRLWPDAPQVQALINIALHALNASLLALLVQRWTQRWPAGLIAGTLFAVHCGSAGTPLWLADRFDLSATAGILAALLALESSIARRRATPMLLLATLWAIGSKEIAVLLAPLVLARLLVAEQLNWTERIRIAAAVWLPIALVMAVRARLLHGVSTTLRIEDPLGAALSGVSAWWARAPQALTSGSSNPDWGAPLIVALVLIAALGWWQGRQVRPRPVGAALVIACLVLLPACVQWPVTQYGLASVDALSNPANLRFYYLAMAGAFAAIGMGLAQLRKLPVAAVPLVLGAIVAVWLPPSRQQASAWAALAMDNRKVVTAALNALENQALPFPCLIEFAGLRERQPDLLGLLDAAIKAYAPVNSPWLQCVVLTDQAPWYSIHDTADCTAAEMAPLLPRIEGHTLLQSRRFGSVCVHYPATPTRPIPPEHLLRLRWQDDRFVVQAASAPL